MGYAMLLYPIASHTAFSHGRRMLMPRAAASDARTQPLSFLCLSACVATVSFLRVRVPVLLLRL